MSVNPRIDIATIHSTTKTLLESNSTITHDESIDTALSITNANGTFYYHRDHQGSIVALTDSNGDVVESFTYDNSYGTIVNHTKTVETNNSYAYTGKRGQVTFNPTVAILFRTNSTGEEYATYSKRRDSRRDISYYQ